MLRPYLPSSLTNAAMLAATVAAARAGPGDLVVPEVGVRAAVA
jgi:hypothetical protein